MVSYLQKPITPIKRFQSLVKLKGIQKKKYFFSFNLNNSSGRNYSGKIVVNHKGGRRSWRYILIDNMRRFNWLPAFIVELTKVSWAQPLAALIRYLNGSTSYITLPLGLTIGSFVNLGIHKITRITSKCIGNLLLLDTLKQNDTFYSGYFKNKKRFFYTRAAGTFCKIRYRAHSNDFFIVTIPSGKEKKLPIDIWVFLGRNSNIFHRKECIGGAGLSRKQGVRPTVRGVAMNPVDHPHGGRTKTNQPEVSPWGWVAKRGY